MPIILAKVIKDNRETNVPFLETNIMVLGRAEEPLAKTLDLRGEVECGGRNPGGAGGHFGKYLGIASGQYFTPKEMNMGNSNKGDIVCFKPN